MLRRCSVVGLLIVLLTITHSVFAGQGPPLQASAADLTAVGHAPSAAIPIANAATPSRVIWPTTADSGIVNMVPIPGGLVILVDTKVSGQVDRVIALHGDFALPPSHFNEPGAVIFWDGGLAVLFHETRETVVFTLGHPGDVNRIRELVPTTYSVEVVPQGLDAVRRTGNFGSFSGPVVQDILYQDPDGTPGQPGCASSCTISCRDGSSCSCTAGSSGCCSCSCGAVGGASCTHSS